MRKNLLITALLLVLAGIAHGQARFGLLVGLNTTELKPGDFIQFSPEGMEELKLAIEEANYGFHFGAFGQFQIATFFIRPEVVYNSNSVDFRLDSLSGAPVSVLTEKYQNLDIPIIAGTKLGPVRVGAGPVGHVFLASTSDLTDIEGYRQDFKNLKVGFQAGIGIDLFKKFSFDLRYEGNFNKFGDHIVIGGQNYAFSQNPERIVATLGIAF